MGNHKWHVHLAAILRRTRRFWNRSDHVLDRLIDYPYSTNQRGRDFLDMLPLAPVDLEKVAHVNADQLLKLTPRH